MRVRSIVKGAAACVMLTALGCTNDVPTGSTLRAVSARAGVSGDLNSVDGLIAALFDVGNATAAGQRWQSVLDARAAGNTRLAQHLMMQLADFAIKKQQQNQLLDPDGSGELTVQTGVLRLLRLMFGEVFPGAPLPPENVPGDAIVAVVDGSHQTVVTPAELAGVEFPAGAAPQPFILVVQQDLAAEARYTEPCTGPLQTPACQFPRFYRFHPYPYLQLNKRAKFGVCHEVQGSRAVPKAIDARVRLAHDAPSESPRPGYQQIGMAEILPLVRIDFLECHPHVPIDVIGSLLPTPNLRAGARVATTLASLAGRLLIPAPAWAIDMGGGGESDFFSNFNVVDPGAPSTDLPPISVVDGKPPRIHRDR